MKQSLPRAYFDDVYRANDDPWQFATSDYERAKYTATLAALPRPHYNNAFEIGCSIGVLSAQLAPRCGRLLCVDASELPLKQARERLAPFGHVVVQQMRLPDQFPADTFDLILLSEVGYYFSPDDLTTVRQRLIDALRPGGHLLLVHWIPVVPDYPLTGDQVHEHFLDVVATGLLRHCYGGPTERGPAEQGENYRLDLFERTAT